MSTVNTTDLIIAYEQGELDNDKTMVLFSELIRTGLAWKLQGHYGRTAAGLIEGGWISKDGTVLEATDTD